MIITDATGESDSIHVEHVGIYKTFTVNNVISYTNGNDFNSWIIDTTSNAEKCQSHLYFIIDTVFSTAFSHWVYECAIYLDLFIMLKKKYSGLKLHFKWKRTFKLLFCSLYGIKEEDIVYSLDPCNISIFPSPISMMNNPEIQCEYMQQLRVFFERFKQYKSSSKTELILILPRQLKENNIGNDRIYDITKIVQFFKESSYLHDICNTDDITDLKYQIHRVSSANTLILTDGSPFLVNGMFSFNANIKIIDTLTIQQSMVYKKMNHIIQFIKEINNTTIEYFSNVDTLYSFLERTTLLE
jgi:hypothetical protein